MSMGFHGCPIVMNHGLPEPCFWWQPIRSSRLFWRFGSQSYRWRPPVTRENLLQRWWMPRCIAAGLGWEVEKMEPMKFLLVMNIYDSNLRWHASTCSLGVWKEASNVTSTIFITCNHVYHRLVSEPYKPWNPISIQLIHWWPWTNSGQYP